MLTDPRHCNSSSDSKIGWSRIGCGIAVDSGSADGSLTSWTGRMGTVVSVLGASTEGLMGSSESTAVLTWAGSSTPIPASSSPKWGLNGAGGGLGGAPGMLSGSNEGFFQSFWKCGGGSLSMRWANAPSTLPRCCHISFGTKTGAIR